MADIQHGGLTFATGPLGVDGIHVPHNYVFASEALQNAQVIGSSTAKGETPKDRPIKPQDVLATMYRHLGIDPALTFADMSGRPVPLLHEGECIDELV